MIRALLLLSSITWGQISTDTDNQAPVPMTVLQSISGNSISIKNLFSGKPRITGIPNFVSGVKVTSVTWSDGTISTTAASGSGSTAWSGITGFPAGCTLPNLVRVVGTALTCTQPSDVTGNAATVTTNANLTGPVTSAGNATTIVGPVPQAAINLSTVTTAFSTKASSGTNADLSNFIGAGSGLTVSTQATYTSSATYINVPISITGSAGTITSASSVTASAFFGDGSHLSGISAGGGTQGTLGYIRDNFLSQTTGSQKNFTLTNTPSANSEQVILDGLLLSAASDYTLTGTALAMTTAPATACTASAASNCTSGFFVQYTTGATGVNAFILNSSQTVSGNTTLTATTTFTSQSTISIQGYMPFFWQTVATATFFSKTAYSITSGDLLPGQAITSSSTYRLTFSVSQVSIGHPQIQFNSDSGSNYYYFNRGADFSNNTESNAANSTKIDISPTSSSPDIQAGQGAGGEITIDTLAGLPKQISVNGFVSGVFAGAATSPMGSTIQGYYSGASALSSIQFNCTASCTGHLILEKYSNTW